jgi:ABC-2 type transport system permease protein
MNFVPTLLGAVLLWDFCTRLMQGVATAFLEDVWSRNFLNLFASPLTIAEYVTGLVLTSVLTSSLGLAVMLLLATAVFGLHFLALGSALAAILAVLFVFGIALGIFGSAVVLRFGPASEWLLWPLPAVLAPFAAVFYPLATLPGWMRMVAHALPPAYLFEALRGLLAGHTFPLASFAAGGALAILQLVLAGVFYGRVYRHAVRTGLLARYSAEGAS